MQPAKNPRNTQEKYRGFLSDVGGFHYDFSAFSRVSVVQDFEARKIVFFLPLLRKVLIQIGLHCLQGRTQRFFERVESYCCLSNSE